MSDLTINPRSRWNARNPRCTLDSRRWSEVTELFVHWPGGDPASWSNVNTVAEVEATLRGWQNYHMDHNGWCDIGYNYALFPQRGTIDIGDTLWVARGGGFTPASQLGHNQGTVSIVVAMGPNDPLVDSTKARLRSFVRWANDNAGRDLRVLGHTQGPNQSTECPGPRLLSYIDNLNAAD